MAQIRASVSFLFGRAGAAAGITSCSRMQSNAAAPSGFPLQ